MYNNKLIVGQRRTQKAKNHPNGPMLSIQGDLMPGGPVASGGETVLTENPPMAISIVSVKPSTNPTALFCEYIWGKVGQMQHYDLDMIIKLTANTLVPKIIWERTVEIKAPIGVQ